MASTGDAETDFPFAVFKSPPASHKRRPMRRPSGNIRVAMALSKPHVPQAAGVGGSGNKENAPAGPPTSPKKATAAFRPHPPKGRPGSGPGPSLRPRTLGAPGEAGADGSLLPHGAGSGTSAAAVAPADAAPQAEADAGADLPRVLSPPPARRDNNGVIDDGGAGVTSGADLSGSVRSLKARRVMATPPPPTPTGATATHTATTPGGPAAPSGTGAAGAPASASASSATKSARGAPPLPPSSSRRPSLPGRRGSATSVGGILAPIATPQPSRTTSADAAAVRLRAPSSPVTPVGAAQGLLSTPAATVRAPSTSAHGDADAADGRMSTVPETAARRQRRANVTDASADIAVAAVVACGGSASKARHAHEEAQAHARAHTAPASPAAVWGDVPTGDASRPSPAQARAAISSPAPSSTVAAAAAASSARRRRAQTHAQAPTPSHQHRDDDSGAAGGGDTDNDDDDDDVFRLVAAAARTSQSRRNARRSSIGTSVGGADEHKSSDDGAAFAFGSGAAAATHASAGAGAGASAGAGAGATPNGSITDASAYVDAFVDSVEADAAFARRLLQFEEAALAERTRLQQEAEHKTMAFLLSEMACAACGRQDIDNIALAGCEHHMCLPCLRRRLASALAQRDVDSHLWMCADGDCSAKVAEVDVRRVFSAEEHAAYLDLELSSLFDTYESGGGIGGAAASTACSVGGAAGVGSATATAYVPLTPRGASRIVRCPTDGCGIALEKVAPTPRSLGRAIAHMLKAGARDDAGNTLSEATLRQREEHRLRCPVCSNDFCTSCGVQPYHLGYTCRQEAARHAAPKCRFCGEVVPPPKPPKRKSVLKGSAAGAGVGGSGSGSTADAASAGGVGGVGGDAADTGVRDRRAAFEAALLPSSVPRNCCDSEDCRERARTACDCVHACGHLCGGVKGEATCLPCMRPECAELHADGSSDGVEGAGTRVSGSQACSDDLCNICWVEELGAAPCVELTCGHVFHLHCASARLAGRWPTPRIGFGFLNCALCNATTDAEALIVRYASQRPFATPLREALRLKKAVEAMALQRLQYEGLAKDPRLSRRGDEYYQQPLRFAMRSFAYYMCSHCEKPYFGGLRSCEDAIDDGGAAAGAGEGGGFDASHLVCGGCAAIESGGEVCAVHGKDAIEFKCKFCCSIASWYCWGSTHFCEDCHTKQMRGESLTHKKLSYFHRCGGPRKCPLGVKHPPNGTAEFSMGCALCRGKDMGF